jgi:hypothetical protein
LITDKQSNEKYKFMTTPTQAQNPNESRDRHSSADSVLGFAVIGLLVAGTVGVLKAMSMDSGVDVLFCLLGSVAAFGAVYFICFDKH